MPRPPALRGLSARAQDFRKLTPLVVMARCGRRGPVVCEPVHRFRLDAPADTLGTLLPVLDRLHAVPHPGAAGRVGARWRATSPRPGCTDCASSFPR